MRLKEGRVAQMRPCGSCGGRLIELAPNPFYFRQRCVECRKIFEQSKRRLTVKEAIELHRKGEISLIQLWGIQKSKEKGE